MQSQPMRINGFDPTKWQIVSSNPPYGSLELSDSPRKSLEPPDSPTSKDFVRYNSPVDGGFLSSIILNLKPSGSEKILAKPDGEKPFYICFICKPKGEEEFKKVFESNKKISEISMNSLPSTVHKKAVFTFWSSPELKQDYFDAMFNVLCNKVVMGVSVIPQEIKEEFRSKIHGLKDLKSEKKIEDDWDDCFEGNFTVDDDDDDDGFFKCDDDSEEDPFDDIKDTAS